MNGIGADQTSSRVTTAVSGTQVGGTHAVSRTLGATSVGVDTQTSGVFVQVEFQVEVDDERETNNKESSRV